MVAAIVGALRRIRGTRPCSASSRLWCLASVLVLALSAAAASACSSHPDDGGVDVLTAHGEINPVMASYLERGIQQASDAHASAVVVQLDTPGGLDSSMRDIVQAIDNSSVPVIVYVSPAGARAASAGTFITLAGHIAAMAPNTAIGAAHPVDSSGGDIQGTLGTKVENDAVAYIRGIADIRGRNADWAEQAVRQSISASETSAVQQHVVDLIAPTIDQLLQQTDGRTVRLNDGREVRIATAGVPIRNNSMNLFEQFLFAISDPNIAYLLLTLGSLALLVELYHPTIVIGIGGALALIVSLFALGSLPTNWAGVAIMGVAVLLFALELHAGAHGALALGGAVLMALSGFLLTDTSNAEFQVSRWLLVVVPGAIGTVIIAFAVVLVRTRRLPVFMSAVRVVGSRGVASSNLDPTGVVLVGGERWQATSVRPIDAGASVRVTGREGLHLTVEPADEAAHER
jgi:membrane-bound serine protease (ClpP class)